MARVKQFAYIAVRVNTERNFPSTLWDMLRYDRCFPVEQWPRRAEDGTEWVVLRQEATPGWVPGFTIDRWRSFGLRVKTCMAEGVPPRLESAQWESPSI